MARLRVRYRNGEDDEWEVQDRMDLLEVAKTLWKGADEMISFTTSTEEGSPSDFGRVGLRMSEVVMWHLDGFVDFPSDAAAWAALESPS